MSVEVLAAVWLRATSYDTVHAASCVFLNLQVDGRPGFRPLCIVYLRRVTANLLCRPYAIVYQSSHSHHEVLEGVNEHDGDGSSGRQPPAPKPPMP